MFAERELVRAVVDDHGVTERERREALRFAGRQGAQRGTLDDDRNVSKFERPELERVDASELQAAQSRLANPRTQRVSDRRHAETARGQLRYDRIFGARVDDEVLRTGVVD